MEAMAERKILSRLYCCILPRAFLLVSILVTLPPGQLYAEISDGAHGGNKHFFFLPPVAPKPSPTGKFVGSLAPVVQICKLTGTDLVLPPIVEFTTTSGPYSERVRVVPGDEHYVVNWRPKPGGDTTKTYRIRVLFRTREGVPIEKELGHADVTLRTMAIKFRIEEGFFPVGELAPKERAKISPVLQRHVAAHDTVSPFKAILTLADANDTIDKQAAFVVLRQFAPTLPNAVVRIHDQEGIALLARNSKVDFVSENRSYHPLTMPSQSVVGQPYTQLSGNLTGQIAAQSASTPAQELIGQPCAQHQGHIGAGTAVALLDTGIDANDPAFSGVEVIDVPLGLGADAVYNCGDAAIGQDCEDEWHGTYVAKQVIQAAPGAAVIMLNVQYYDCDWIGWHEGCYIWTEGILTAIDWILENRDTYNVVAINMSFALDDPGSFSTESCPLDSDEEESFLSLRDHGIMPFAGSGNDGLLQGVSTPACAPSVVSVAAVDPTTDEIWPDSTRGPNLDLLAPGCDGGLCGTSLASPIAAGAWAVMRAAHPELSLDETLETLKTTGVPIYDPATGLSFPRIQLDAALNVGNPWPPCYRLVVEFEWQDVMRYAIRCVDVSAPGGRCFPPPPGCPECYPALYEGDSRTIMPDELISLYEDVTTILTNPWSATHPISFFIDLYNTVEKVKPDRYVTEQLRHDVLQTLDTLIVFKSPTIDPNATAQLVHLMNDMELDWRAQSPLSMSLPVNGTHSVNLGAFAELEIQGIKKAGTVGLAINSGMPWAVTGIEPLWPILSYQFDFTEQLPADAQVEIRFFFGGYSFDRKTANLHVLEWDGSTYRDVTTAVDLEHQYIIARTNRLGTYVIGNGASATPPMEPNDVKP